MGLSRSNLELKQWTAGGIIAQCLRRNFSN